MGHLPVRKIVLAGVPFLERKTRKTSLNDLGLPLPLVCDHTVDLYERPLGSLVFII